MRTHKAHEILRISPARYRYVRQSVKLSGAGTQAFSEGKRSIEQMHEMLDRYFEENSLEAIGGEADTIELANRYLTPKKDAPQAQHIGFDKRVDPKGVLEDMAREGEGFVHTEDNVVGYWQRKTDAEGNHK